MSARSLLKLNKGNEIHLGSLKAIFVKVSQNFIKSHLKFCLISQISAHSLWHVCTGELKIPVLLKVSILYHLATLRFTVELQWLEH